MADYPEDREYDQLQFEKNLAERSKAVYDAIHIKDDSKVRWILGVPAAGSTETGGEAHISARSSTPPTAEGAVCGAFWQADRGAQVFKSPAGCGQRGVDAEGRGD